MTRSRATAKKAGTELESAVVARLKLAFPNRRGIERRAKTGSKDQGDISGVYTTDDEPIVVECKNVSALSLGSWIAEAEVERNNARASAAVVVHKRRGVGLANMDDQFVTMTFRDFLVLIGDYRSE